MSLPNFFSDNGSSLSIAFFIIPVFLLLFCGVGFIACRSHRRSSPASTGPQHGERLGLVGKQLVGIFTNELNENFWYISGYSIFVGFVHFFWCTFLIALKLEPKCFRTQFSGE